MGGGGGEKEVGVNGMEQKPKSRGSRNKETVSSKSGDAHPKVHVARSPYKC